MVNILCITSVVILLTFEGIPPTQHTARQQICQHIHNKLPPAAHPPPGAGSVQLHLLFEQEILCLHPRTLDMSPY